MDTRNCLTTSALRSFLTEVPPCGVEVAGVAPYTYGDEVYDLALWFEYAGVQNFTASMFECFTPYPLYFLWRPRTRQQFWSIVKKNNLKHLSPDSGPAAAGLIVKPGTFMQPLVIAYDLQAMLEICELSFWDSSSVSQTNKGVSKSKAWRMQHLQESKVVTELSMQVADKLTRQQGAPWLVDFKRA